MKRILLSILMFAAAANTRGANEPVVLDQATSGFVGVPFSYQIIATAPSQFPIDQYSAAPLPPGLNLTAATGVISGTPTAAGVYSVIIAAHNSKGWSNNATLTITITIPSFVGFRLPDFPATPTPSPTSAANNMQLMLQMGANGGTTTANRFNATLEVDASDAPHTLPIWVPYNHFIGITDTNPNYSFRDSWITDAALPVRELPGSASAPSPYPSPPAFGSTQLTTAPPGVYMKTDPRATRFGIFQSDTNPTTDPTDARTSRIVLSLWPGASSVVPNGFGGTVGTIFPGFDVEHVPNRFSSAAYYPATFAINGPVDARDNATTIYADNDNVTRPADAIYPGAGNTTGSSTPYYTSSASYRPIILNRPFRNVAELGYAFRDLPWKTLDFFTDKSADAGLLDVFTVNDGPRVLDSNANVVGMAPPTMTAGSVNLNTTQAADLQAVFAGSILDEINSTTVNPTGTGATDAPVLATQVVSATATTLMQNKSELITRANLPTTILPTASNDNQAVKARREVIARTVSSVAQTRTWNLLIDVVAQTGRFKPNAGNLQNDFIVEGEQHYWVHVAIDRFTGKVIDKQIEVVNE